MIDALYGCQCSCCQKNNLLDKEEKKPEEGFAFSEEDIEAMMMEIYNQEVDQETGISPTMYQATREAFRKAISEGLSNTKHQAIDKDKELVEALKHSGDVFALRRSLVESQTLADKLYDGEGKLKTYQEWKKDTASITAHYNESWLRTEYDTAVLRSEQAAEWKEFEADADIFPNLRWMPTTSILRREDHKVFYDQKLTLPIGDKFWNNHRPGNEWNCKCWLQQTDEPVTKNPNIPKDAPSAQPGLKGNPAKTGKIFSCDHHYFSESCAVCELNKDGKVHGLCKGQIYDGKIKGDCVNCDYTLKLISRFDEEKQKKIDNNKKIFDELVESGLYKGLVFNKENGAMKGSHIRHIEHKKENEDTYFEENLTSTELEEECMNVAFEMGHSFVLREEGRKGKNGKIETSLDAFVDGILADIRSVTPKEDGTEHRNFRNQISDKNKQLERWNELHEDKKSDSICLYFHDMSMFSEEKVIEGYKHYLKDKHLNGTNYYKTNEVKNIICIGKGFFKIYTF